MRKITYFESDFGTVALCKELGLFLNYAIRESKNDGRRKATIEAKKSLNKYQDAIATIVELSATLGKHPSSLFLETK